MKFRILCILLFYTANAFSQITIGISGTVTDATTGKPIGATWVRARATYYATMTNTNGAFQLPAKPKGVLVISHPNYKTQKIKIQNREYIEVRLVPNPKKNKIDLDSAFKSLPIQTHFIKSCSFNGGIITHPLQALTGKMPGFNVSKQGSNPEHAPTALIRGLGTLQIGSEPLYVVDDVPNVPIDQLAIEEIESVEVLHGAAATAYGLRGANGVVLIKTKSSHFDSTSVQYRSWVGIETIARQPDLLDAQTFRELAKSYPSFIDNSANTDWIAATTRPAYSVNQHLSLGKRTEQFNVRASIGFLKQQGNIQTTDNERITARLKVEQLLFNDKLKIGFQLSLSKFFRHHAPDSMFAFYLRSMRPTDPILNPNGTYFERPEIYLQVNPVGYLKNTTDERKRLDGLGQLFLKYQFNHLFSFQLTTAWRIQNEHLNYYQGQGTMAQERGGIGQKYREGEARQETHQQQERFLEAALYFQNSLKKHEMNGKLGYAFQDHAQDGFRAKNTRFITDALSFNNLGAGTGLSLVQASANGSGNWVSSYQQQARYISFFGQFNYTFNKAYFTQIHLRRDGSSKFAAGRKWGLFPSIVAGWNLRELRLLNHWRFFQTLTLRFNYGIAGNSDGLLPQRSQELMGALPQSLYFDGSSNSYKPSYGVTQLANPTLQWEQTRSRGMGLDFTILNKRLRTSLDWYQRHSSGVIWPSSAPFRYPNSYPTQLILLNTGTIQNKGLEWAVEATVIRRKNFQWELNWTGATNQNKLISMSDNEIKAYNSEKIILGSTFVSSLRNNPWFPTNVLKADVPVGAFWGFPGQGLDKNGNFKSEGSIFQPLESNVIGSPQPTFTTALTNHISFKQWQMSFLWNGRFGHQLIDLNRLQMSQQAQRLPNENALQESISSPVKDTRIMFNSYWLENGNFLRLDNIVLHYEFKPRPQIKGMKAFVGANNLLLWTRYSGIDPEMDLGNITGGVQYLQFFYKSRGFNAGFQIEF